MMALVWGSGGRNEVTRSECKGKSQRFPWKSLLLAEVVFDLDFMMRMLRILLHPPPEPVFDVTCLIAGPRALTCSECCCGVLTDTHSTRFPRALRALSVYCCPLWCVDLAIRRRTNPGLSLYVSFSLLPSPNLSCRFIKDPDKTFIPCPQSVFCYQIFSIIECVAMWGAPSRLAVQQ